MKKSIRKILSLALCLMLLLSMSAMASAATVTWGSGLEQRTLTVSPTGTVYYDSRVTSKSYSHTYGTPTDVHFVGTYSSTYYAGYTGEYVHFLTYINQAMSAEGMLDTFTKSISELTLTLPATNPTGSYQLYVRYQCKNASWSVYTGITGRAIEVPDSASGLVNHAPTGSYTYVLSQTT